MIGAFSLSKAGRFVSVSQLAHVDVLLTWIIIYSYDANWLINSIPYSGRLGSADSLCNRRARTRMHAHWLVGGFAGSFVFQ